MSVQHFSAGKAISHLLIYVMLDTSKLWVKRGIVVTIIMCQEMAQRGGLSVWTLQLDCLGSSPGSTTH